MGAGITRLPVLNKLVVAGWPFARISMIEISV